MGRSVNKKINAESSQSIDSSLSLLCLPNELLEMILSYLSSTDIVRSFFEINSNRIETLIENSLVHFNLASVIINKEQWIKKYFLDQSRLADCLLSLCLTDEQMKFLSKSNIQFIQLVSLHIINIKDNSIFHIDIIRIIPLLRSLSLDFSPDEMSHDSIGCLARILFSQRKSWQEQLENLSINNIYIPFGFNSLQSMPSLRHLTINVRCENQLFDLCSYLPNIESFRVDVRRSSFISSDYSFNRVDVSPYLKKLTISGEFSSHSILYKFILIYKSSLEYLKLIDIRHPDLVDGHQLHSEIVKHLSPTIQFHFHFQFQVNMKEFFMDNYLKTFDWTQVMIDPNIDDNSITIIVSSISTLHSRYYLASHGNFKRRLN